MGHGKALLATARSGAALLALFRQELREFLHFLRVFRREVVGLGGIVREIEKQRRAGGTFPARSE